MATRFTEEQLEAINRSGENIIVSAGAGSGKTAVLTTRVVRKLKEGTHLNELLILTFTNAAAFEMKERIRSKILENEEIIEELDNIDLAYITTFDAFALSMVKKYHYILNVSSNIGIIESSVIDVVKQKLISEISEELLKENNQYYISLIKDFCLKSADGLHKSILSIYNKFHLMYDFDDYLDNFIETYYNDEHYQYLIDNYESIINKKNSELKALLENLYYEADSEYYYKIEEILKELLECSNYEEYKNILEIKLPAVPKGSSDEIKYLKTSIKSKIDEIKALLTYDNKDEITKEIINTVKYTKGILEFIRKLNIKLMNYKRQYDLYEFTDIAKLLIKLVKENKEVCNEIKTSFNEILVDEYQDTSDLQELFLKEVENNNIYMVGDMKQSIYRFRNANPKIFKDKYDSYAKNVNGSKIDLNKNFRSRNTVLYGINDIFDLIMDNSIGGAKYKEEHQLIFGNTSYTEKGSSEQNMEVEVIEYSADENKKFINNEIEAFIMARDIKKKVEEKYLVFDKDDSILRPCRYSDFAILVDNKKNFDLYKQILTYFNIPSEIHKEELLTNSTLFSTIKHILILINKNKIDTDYLTSYMAIARSFISEMNDEEIFVKVSNKDFSNDEIINRINEIKLSVNSKTPIEIINDIIASFDIYNKLVLIGDVESSLVRIDSLLNLVNNLATLKMDITDITTFLCDLNDYEIDIKFSRILSSNDAVKIMTIHKSKGLEFYVCYFPGIDSKFNLRDTTERFNFDKRVGLITPYVDNGLHTTIMPTILKDFYLQDEISEKLRVFYVALTRAKEKVIIISPSTTNNIVLKENNLISKQTRMNYRSFKDIIDSIKDDLDKYYYSVDFSELDLTKDYQTNINDLSLKIDHNKFTTSKEVKVNDLIVNSKNYSAKINKLISYEEKMLLEAGNMLHNILELADFNYNNFTLSDEVKNIIDSFLNCEIVSDINKATVYREYEFIYEKDNQKGHGIIDLLLVYEDKIKVIDYKFKNIDSDNYVKQLEGYKEYLASITDKPVELYLYSLIGKKYKQIN